MHKLDILHECLEIKQNILVRKNIVIVKITDM